MVLQPSFNGSGDRRVRGEAQVNNLVQSPGYRKRRLWNGLPIPVFVREKNDEDRVLDDSGPRPKFDSVTNIVEEYLSCPLCGDICIESTSTNCGHKFCRECIDMWRRQKQVCPICSTLITSLHRQYRDDSLIETQLDNLSPDVKLRFLEAQQKRLNKLLLENRSPNFLKQMRRKLDDSLIFLKSKNVSSLEERWNSTTQLIQSKMHGWLPDWNFSLILGITLGTLLLLFVKNIRGFCNFMQYLWLSMKKYNGVIPEHLLKDGLSSSVRKTVEKASLTATPSVFEQYVERVSILGWIFRRN